jgi:RNA polymerase sigma-70 factor (ECF subfamily)
MTAIEFNHQLVTLEGKLSRMARALTTNKEDVKDLIQETFAKAIAYRDKFEDDTNLAAWTYTIMRNTFINNYRRSMKAKTTMDNTNDQHYLNLNFITRSELPDATYSVGEIQKLIDNLGDDFRIPFTMHTQGYKYHEIADKLSLKMGTVKSRIYFARKKLMPLLV